MMKTKISVPVLVIIILSVSAYLSSDKKALEENENLSGSDNVLLALNSVGIEDTILSLDFNFLSATQGVSNYIPSLSILFDDIGQIPGFGVDFANSLAITLNNPPTLIHCAFRLSGALAGGFGPPVIGVENPGAKENISEEEILSHLKDICGLKFMENGYDEWAKLPKEFRNEIISTIHVIFQASFILSQFAEPIISLLDLNNSERIGDIYKRLSTPWKNRQLSDFSAIDAINRVDLKKLAYASRIVSVQLGKIISQKEISSIPDFTECIIHTNFGTIGIYGYQNDTITDNHTLLINLGGDDYYSGSAASSISIDKPIGIVIDFAGNDNYYCPDGFLGAGIMGLGFLFDLNGDDKYLSGSVGIGASLYGTSMVYDANGQDEYKSKSDFSMGSARIGVAFLVDSRGDDKYFSMGYSQGFGGTLGVGVLIDNIGNDIYAGNQSDFGNPAGSFSFVQGAASGRWAEATDGHSLGGGYGFLIDMSGDDKYYAKSFAQGAAYYFGLGTLYDHSGDDHYNSISHSQGYATHFALACLVENGGTDTYNCCSDSSKITQIIGGGRDFSAGWFIDSEGNDNYNFGNRSAGVGDMNGLGILVDLKGNDSYSWQKNSINRQSSSMGKSFDLENSMIIDYRIHKKKHPINKGIFYDDEGENKFK